MNNTSHHRASGRISRRRRQPRPLVPALSIVALFLAACAGSDDDGTAPTADATLPAETSAGTVPPTDPPTDDSVSSPTSDETTSSVGGSEESTTTSTAAPASTSPPSTTIVEDVDPFDDILERVGDPTDRYGDQSLWFCQGVSGDSSCASDLDVTVVHPDGSSEVVQPIEAPAPEADCFYVYPTVDGRAEPGNTSLDGPRDVEMVGLIKEWTSRQAAPFSPLCRVFAPLYEQATFGTYDLFGPEAPDLTSGPFDVAYEQVLDAFRWYMKNENQGRPIVLIGHSQGAHHLARLTADVFEPDPELTERLVVSALIGGGGYGVNVAAGDRAGGTVGSIPLCDDLGGTGCVIAYNSYLAGSPPTTWIMDAPPDHEAACVNPTELVTDAATVTASRFGFPIVGVGVPVEDISGIDLGEISTSFVGISDAYESACVSDGGRTWLEITPLPPTGSRPEIPLPNAPGIGLGLHGIDVQLMSGDLLQLVEAKIATATS